MLEEPRQEPGRGGAWDHFTHPESESPGVHGVLDGWGGEGVQGKVGVSREWVKPAWVWQIGSLMRSTYWVCGICGCSRHHWN